MADSLRDLVVADKLIATNSEWSPNGRTLEIKLPLEIDGYIEEQFFFRATVIPTLPDEMATFQLEYHGITIPGGTGPLCRFDWRPKGIHNNKGQGPASLRFIEQAGTHFHSFEDNWCERNGALLRDNLPIARPVTQPIQGFRECLNHVGNLFRINNIDVVKTPPWVIQMDLKWTR